MVGWHGAAEARVHGRRRGPVSRGHRCPACPWTDPMAGPGARGCRMAGRVASVSPVRQTGCHLGAGRHRAARTGGRDRGGGTAGRGGSREEIGHDDQYHRHRSRRADRTAARPRLLRRRPLPALCPAAGRGPGGLQRGRGVLGGQPPRGGGGHLPRPRDLLLGQGHLDHGDRGGVPHAPDHDAHRPARPRPLPQAGPARLPARPSCVPSRTGSGPGPSPWSTQIEAGVPVDIVPELAVPLPLQVISDLLGVPEDEWPRFFRWSEAVIPGATDWSEEERMALSRRDGHLPPGRGGRPPGPPEGRHHLRAGGGRGRRGPAVRRRAGHVPRPAAGGRKRDHPQHDVRRPARPGLVTRGSGRPCATGS